MGSLRNSIDLSMVICMSMACARLRRVACGIYLVLVLVCAEVSQIGDGDGVV